MRIRRRLGRGVWPRKEETLVILVLGLAGTGTTITAPSAQAAGLHDCHLVSPAKVGQALGLGHTAVRPHGYHDSRCFIEAWRGASASGTHQKYVKMLKGDLAIVQVLAQTGETVLRDDEIFNDAGPGHSLQLPLFGAAGVAGWAGFYPYPGHTFAASRGSSHHYDSKQREDQAVWWNAAQTRDLYVSVDEAVTRPAAAHLEAIGKLLIPAAEL